MSKELFKIRELDCKYPNSSDLALKVEELNIDEGEVVFIVGPSGVGKSTILETIGLMNNTTVSKPETVLDFYSNGSNKPEDFTKIWLKREGVISGFRRKHLSFIFQSTNLVPTLTVFDNIILPALLQGVSRPIALEKARKILEKIAPDLDGNVKTYEIAGGERQRVAFARAIIGDFSILFADEPTGNLDRANAFKLISHLMEFLHEDNITAVIVTHDVELAVKYASKIVFIEKVSDEKSHIRFGRNSKKTSFIKNNEKVWTDLDSEDIVEFIEDDQKVKIDPDDSNAKEKKSNEDMKKVLIQKLIHNS